MIGLLFAIVLGVKVALDWFLDTEVGLGVRCLEDEGAGEYALERNGLAPARFQILALCLGNAIVAGTGALVSFKEGAANAQRGFDILITGLVAFLLGEQVRAMIQAAPRHPVVRPTTGALLGGIAYFGLMTLSQRFHVPAGFTKIALVVLVALTAAPRSAILNPCAAAGTMHRVLCATGRSCRRTGYSFGTRRRIRTRCRNCPCPSSLERSCGSLV